MNYELHGRSQPLGDALRKAHGAVKLLRWLRRLGLKRRIAGVNIDSWDSFRAMVMPCLLLHGELSDVLTEEIVGRMQSVKAGFAIV